jgi:hypothetical protein
MSTKYSARFQPRRSASSAKIEAEVNNLFRIAIAACVLLVAPIAGAQIIYFEGKQVGFGGDRPYVSKGTVMLPARDTMERIGGALERNENGQRIHLTWWNNKVQFRKGDRFFLYNGQRTALTTSSEDREGVLYLPLPVFRTLTDGRIATTPGGYRPGGGTGRPDNSGRWDLDGGRPNGTHLYFDNRRIEFDGAEAVYRKDGTLMVPFRAMGDAIGGSSDRTADGKRVWINFRGNRVEYDKGHIWYRINGQRQELDTTSEERGELLFVPVELFEAVTGNKVRVR